MLEASKDRIVGTAPAEEPSTAEMFANAIGIARRQIFIVLLFAILGMGLGAVAFLKATPTYTATATLLVDTRKIEILQQPAVSSEMPIESMGAMESQVELLKSDEVALSVIKKLRLWEDPRFIGLGKPGFVWSQLHDFLPVLFPEQPPPSDEQRMELALSAFSRSLSVTRLGITYAIEISFESGFPDLAAKVANDLADTYIDRQRTSEYDAARQASNWLETRIPELRAKSEAAQRAVVDYKNEHNIVETGSGQLINDQRLAELNTKLNAAHDETLKAKARFDQLNAVGGTEVPAANSTASVGNGADDGDVKNDSLRQITRPILRNCFS